MMLLRKVDGEPEEFAGLRDCLWRFCEIGEKNVRQRKDVRQRKCKTFSEVTEKLAILMKRCDAEGVADNKKEENQNEKQKRGKKD